jgi:hypothetical protein
VLKTFMYCGWPSWVVLLLTVMALGASGVAILLSMVRSRTPAMVVAVAAVLVALGSFGVAGIGDLAGRAKVDSVLASPGIGPEQRVRIQEAGYSDAAGCLMVGGVLGTPTLLFALGALALSLLRKGKVPGTAPATPG